MARLAEIKQMRGADMNELRHAHIVGCLESVQNPIAPCNCCTHNQGQALKATVVHISLDMHHAYGCEKTRILG